MYAQRAAKYEKVEEYADRDMVKGLLAELDRSEEHTSELQSPQ